MDEFPFEIDGFDIRFLIAEKDLQKVTDSHIEEIEKIGADKEKEIMSV